MPAPKGNRFALGNSGRPPKYKNPQELQERIESYFAYCLGEYEQRTKIVKEKDPETKEVVEKEVSYSESVRPPERPMLTGLALYLGFSDKSSLYDYGKKKEFSHSIKRAISIIESIYEESLLHSSNSGAIFALKNFGWLDKQINELTGRDGEPIKAEVKKTVVGEWIIKDCTGGVPLPPIDE